jgi:hypothetical protein
MRRIVSRIREQRGAALVLVAASMFAIVAAVAIAVDVSMLLTARAEAQRAADSGALAGAGWLIVVPDDEAGARAKAEEFAESNRVRGKNPDVLPDTDVDVILDSAKVRVRVHMEEARNLAIPTFFARVIGVDEVDVSAVAAAWAAPQNEVPPDDNDCLLPVALLDDWDDANDNGMWDPGEAYDPLSSYGDRHIGDIVVAKTSGSQTSGPPQCQTESPYVDIDACRDEPDSDNWRCWYRESENADGGVDELGPMIYPGENCLSLAVDDTIWTASASGGKQSLTHTDYDAGGPGSFADLINADPNVFWCDPDGEGGNDGFVCRDHDPNQIVESSPRIKKVPIVSPPNVNGTGSGVNTTIVDFTGVFIELVSCNWDLGQFGGPPGNWNVYFRIMRAQTTGTGGGGGEEPPETTLKTLQLIE